MNAREVLKDRDGIVRLISPDDTVFDAVKAMDSFKVGALMVIDKTEKLVGIISERDYTRKVVLKDRSSSTTKVSEIMTKKIAQVDPDAGIEKCMDIMGKHRVHLPVVEKGKVVGVTTSTDLLILTVNEKDNIIEQLERYISPGGY